MNTQFYDKVYCYITLEYTNNSYKQEEFKETINDLCNILVDLEAITSEEQHMPYLC